MKIAIIAPSPIPFGLGGAEKLWWGLVDAITKHSNHQCELIKLPISENDFWSLLNAYESFYTMDLSHFDMVISGKYPAWMTPHTNHQVYMLHCLRGLYDTWHFTGLPDTCGTANPTVMAFLNSIRGNWITPDEVFASLAQMKNDTSLPSDLFDFPGAFAREVIHYLDNWGLSRVQRITAISDTVAKRREYYPSSTPVQTIYPPSTLTGFNNNSSDYFFTASRLDEPKRIKLMVEAYLKTSTDKPLKIAGTGPMASELAAMAVADKRIEFVGYVSDTALVDYYANAYAVIFIPFDEDYGLITIEAMKSEKPVITFNDAGGVTEFVKHGKTGLISKPDVKALAKNIDKLAFDAKLCAQMGRAAKQSVTDINWPNTVERLIEQAPMVTRSHLKKITVVSSYPVYPPRGGGQNRIFHLYKQLAKTMTVELVCIVLPHLKQQTVEIAPGFFETRVPKTAEHEAQELIMADKAGIPVTDIALFSLYELTPAFIEAVKKASEDADVVIASHPYTFPLLKKYIDKPLAHESHNVEYLLKKQMLKDSDMAKDLLQQLFEAEKQACLDSLFTTVCAMDDADTMKELYGFDPANAVLVPNGVDLDSVPYQDAEQRRALKKSLGLSEQPLVLFIGSWHQPNIEASDVIHELAKTMTDHHFIIMGSVGGYYHHHEKQHNVGYAGIVDDDEKAMYLNLADIAVNPMLSGSGTNLKMFDYMASGIPVVSTKVGARGIDKQDELLVIAEVEDFEQAIRGARVKVDTVKCRQYVEQVFAWSEIKQHYAELLKQRCQ